MDVDIDFKNRAEAFSRFNAISASRVENNELVIHHTGVYVQNIPHDPIKRMATIPFREAEARGYFKLDFLNVGIYLDVRDPEHLAKLANTEPMWELLEEKEFVDLLFHISGHSYITKRMKPKSIPELAAVIAMIRPGKRHLIGKPWDVILKEIWKINDNEAYSFKKSHGHSYALAIVVHMNLLCEKAKNGESLWSTDELN